MVYKNQLYCTVSSWTGISFYFAHSDWQYLEEGGEMSLVLKDSWDNESWWFFSSGRIRFPNVHITSFSGQNTLTGFMVICKIGASIFKQPYNLPFLTSLPPILCIWLANVHYYTPYSKALQKCKVILYHHGDCGIIKQLAYASIWLMVENENSFNLPAASSMKSSPGVEEWWALQHRLMRDSLLGCHHKTLCSIHTCKQRCGGENCRAWAAKLSGAF